MRGIIKKLDKFGRLPIPKSFRDALGLNSGDEMVVNLRDNELVIRKHNKYVKCAMTGKTTDDIKEYGNGIFLSEEGRKMLLEVLFDDDRRET